MRNLASPRFWSRYRLLPEAIQKLAVKNFEMLKADPHHPSLHFKKVGPFGRFELETHYRALGRYEQNTIVWFWIGSHAEYDKLI